MASNEPSESVETDVDSTPISWGPLRFRRFRSLILGEVVLTVGLAGAGFDLPGTVIMTMPVVLTVSLSVFLGLRGLEYTVDPDRNTILTHVEWGDRTFEQRLRWAVRVRRVDLRIMSLFLFSNRGKRWYEGPHYLLVPTERATEVESALRGMVDSRETPPKIRRDERVIVGGVGLSMLGIGPLLYLLSGEAALLFITGPSTLIAPGLLLHSILG